jgi:hypothetical protein
MRSYFDLFHSKNSHKAEPTLSAAATARLDIADNLQVHMATLCSQIRATEREL